MTKIGFDFPQEPRKTALHEAEEWYQHFLADKMNRPYEPVKRSNFGQYSMAINFLTSVMEEARAVNKVAIFNIDHMSQIRVSGKDAAKLLDRVLPISIEKMKIGQCKYTLLLTEQGTVLDDLIMMRVADNEFILVINAGHDITDKVTIDGKTTELTADADYIASYLKQGEEVKIEDISDTLAKIDVQGPYSYKLIAQLYGKEVLRNRNNPDKNMGFFTFNEFQHNGKTCYLSRTGYTNRWGWEMYLPVEHAQEEFKKIAELAYSFGGLVVGLGGRDENRISAGSFGLPLYGHEYDKHHTPTNAPLFNAAIEMDKAEFTGKKELLNDIENKVNKRMVLFITEGIVTNRGIYLDGKRLGSVTSSINSPNIPHEKRLYLESTRKSVNEEDGIAAIGLGWLYHNPFETDSEGNDVLIKDERPVRITVEYIREDADRNPVGKPVKGYISGDGVNQATAPKPLKHIEKL
jgi:aminomethyltransferase